MFEQAFGRFVSGALWGLGAGVVLAVVRGGGTDVKPLARGAMKAYLTASEKIQELTAEARESIEDLYAEARSEQEAEDHASPAERQSSSKSTSTTP